MPKSKSALTEAKKSEMKKEEAFSSNAIRLTLKEIVFTAFFFVVGFFFILPLVWGHAEEIKIGDDFRISYNFRDDYWVYERWVEKAAADFPVLFMGDSVVWGMYVDNQSTLPAMLNRKLGKELVANLAIDGLHSVAIKGLLDNYGGAIKDKKVFLHYNPLWMTNKKYDLSGEEEMTPNHPRLIPQFAPSIKSYKVSLGTRMGITLERHVPFFLLLSHIRLAFFGNEDFKQWIVDNSDKNPFSMIRLTVDAAEKQKMNSSRNWLQNNISKQDWNWLPLADSRQWQAFQSIVDSLTVAGNEVCVMVGPINPYMLTADSLAIYRQRQAEIKAWLDSKKIECVIVPDLPSEVYADASHPLKAGYELIADELLKTQLLAKFR